LARPAPDVPFPPFWVSFPLVPLYERYGLTPPRTPDDYAFFPSFLLLPLFFYSPPWIAILGPTCFCGFAFLLALFSQRVQLVIEKSDFTTHLGVFFFLLAFVFDVFPPDSPPNTVLHCPLFVIASSCFPFVGFLLLLHPFLTAVI